MKTKIIGFLSFLMFAICIKLVAAPLDPGEKIFSSRCMACHKINADFAGPALAGVDKRHSIDWIIKFVHSSQTVIKSGDTSAMALFKKFNGIVMPDHPDLSNDDIKSVVAFIKDESMKVTTPEKKPLDMPYQFQPNYQPVNVRSVGFLLFLASIIVLVLALLFAVKVKQVERNMHKK